MPDADHDARAVDDEELSALTETAASHGLLAAWREHLENSCRRVAENRLLPRLHAEHIRALVAADPEATLDEDARELRLTTAVAGADDHGALRLSSIPGVVESDGSPVASEVRTPFSNWGRTVANVPAVTYYPTTVGGVQSIVRRARADGRRVRCAGYRHTWTDLYGQTDEVLISMLPRSVVTDLPAFDPPIDPDDQLQGIQLLPPAGGEQDSVSGGSTRLCRIGAATTNEQFRRWCLDPDGGNSAWTLPLNAVMVEMTFGGTNATVCHGAGRRNSTLSDLVRRVEFVNAVGEVQVVDDPELLRSAGAAFGLLGVVTAVTLELDPMTYARMAPRKLRAALAVPPPAGYDVPAQMDLSGITDHELARAVDDFDTRCRDDYYAEWFWFTLQPDCYVNTWRNDGRRGDAIDFPGRLGSLEQWVGEYLVGELVRSGAFNDLTEEHQARLLSTAAMEFLPTADVTTPLIDAIHFRRGVQNMRVWDMEMEIPIPELDGTGEPDWSICRRAWWDAISTVYRLLDQPEHKVPMRLTLEMRVMGSSEAVLAPQRGNTFGTCSIEVLTTVDTDPDDWTDFCQQLSDAWLSYTDAAGAPLRCRPHWAKQWQGLTLRGQPANDYLRDVAYADALPEFWSSLSRIAEQGGYHVSDLRARFATPLADQVLVPRPPT